MAGRTKNVNLNKEPFEGYVRHWRRQWVPYGDRTKENKGAWALRLIKWVQTESRVSSGPARHPHIAPVTDLSLVPGARIGGQTAAAAATGAPAAAAAAAVEQQPQAPTATQQQQQQGTPVPAAAAAPHAANHQQQQPGPSAFAGAATAAAAAGDAQQQQQQLPRVSSLNALSIDVPASQQDAGAAAAAATAAGASGPPSFVLPSPSVVMGGAFTYSHLSVSQLQLQMTGSDFANYAAGAPSAGGAATASGYTAGTERTDSDALGRLPHAGGPAASGYTDSMDVDIDGAAGASQGGLSQQQRGGGGVSMVAGSMDTAGDDLDEDDDAEGDEEEEGDEDDQEGEEEEEHDEEDDDDEEEEDEGYADDGLEDDGLGDVGGDMP